MSPTKPEKTRIQKPLRKDDQAPARKPPAKGGNFTAPRRLPATGAGETVAPFAGAQYTLSIHDPRELPAPSGTEVAFAGRSNAGKSSAINALAGRRRLAFVSKTPGRTQLLNFFALDEGRFLVDLPGYGYAGVPGAVRDHWKTLVGTYIAERASLGGVVVVMDCRHPLTPLDRTLLQWLQTAGRPVHILLTKSDKLSYQAGQKCLAEVRRTLGKDFPGTTCQLFSSLKRLGLAEAAEAIARFGGEKNKAPAKGE